MRNHDAILIRLQAVLHDEIPIGVGHVQAIGHHDGANGYVHLRPSQPEHLGNVRILKIELTGSLVVFLVERTAGGEDSNSHGMFRECRTRIAASQSKIKKLRNTTQLRRRRYFAGEIKSITCAVDSITIISRRYSEG